MASYALSVSRPGRPSSRVARSTPSTSTPVAIGSRVPAWPTLRVPASRRTRATTSWRASARRACRRRAASPVPCARGVRAPSSGARVAAGGHRVDPASCSAASRRRRARWRRARRRRRRRRGRGACGTGRRRRRTGRASPARARRRRRWLARREQVLDVGRVLRHRVGDERPASGVNRMPVCRPTSVRSTPFALSSAAAVAACSLVVAVAPCRRPSRRCRSPVTRASVIVTKPSRGSLTRCSSVSATITRIRSASLRARAGSAMAAPRLVGDRAGRSSRSRCAAGFSRRRLRRRRRADSRSTSGPAGHEPLAARRAPRRQCAGVGGHDGTPTSARRCRSRCPTSAARHLEPAPQLGDDRPDDDALLLQRVDVAEQQVERSSDPDEHDSSRRSGLLPVRRRRPPSGARASRASRTSR